MITWDKAEQKKVVYQNHFELTQATEYVRQQNSHPTERRAKTVTTSINAMFTSLAMLKLLTEPDTSYRKSWDQTLHSLRKEGGLVTKTPSQFS